MLESFELRALLAKIETTEGTDAVPTGVANAIQIMNGTVGVANEKLERPLDRPYFTADPFVPVGEYGFIEGDIELVGAAAAGSASPLSPILRASSLAESLVVGPPALARYNPVSSSIASISAYFHHAGVQYKLLGARAKLSGLTIAIKKYPMAKVRIEGNCVQGVEAAFPGTVDYSAFGAPMPVTTETWTLTVNGVAVEGLSLSLDLNTELKVKEHSEARIARISDRKPTGTIRFYRPSFGTLNPWTLFRNQTLVPIIATLDNGTAARKVKLTLGQVQLEEPKEVEEEKDIAYEIGFRALPSSSGNDDFTLEFGG